MSAIPAFACPVCAGTHFHSVPVLWAELVERWDLSPAEAASIDRQQGLLCGGCGNNLRSMALAAAILNTTGARRPLAEAVGQAPLAGLSILEINPAGGLTPTLACVPGHRMLEYPEINLSGLPPAFHGAPGSERVDLRVHTEFGEDVWSIVLAAGFRHCTIHALEFPAGLAIEARN
jgi:hypothetical protein